MRHLATVLAVASSLWLAGVAAEDLEPLARELLVSSGLSKQLEPYPDMVKLGLQQARGQSSLSEAQLEALITASVTAFDPKAMREVAVRTLKTRLTREEMQGALRWLNAPLGRKVTQLEEQASTAQAYQDMQAWAPTLESNPPPASRAALLRRLDKASGVTDFAVTSQLNTQLAIVSALTATQSATDQRAAFDKIRAAFEQARPRLRQSMEQLNFVGMAYAYRTLPDAELEQYVAFTESPLGRKYTAAGFESLDQAVVQAAHNAGKIFGDALRMKKT